jgi:hypothetical protein
VPGYSKGESQVQAFLDKGKPYSNSFKVSHTIEGLSYLVTFLEDAYLHCELFYKEELEPYKKRGVQLLNLRNLTRQHENITGVTIQTKLQFQAVLEQVFPEYKGVFGDQSIRVIF